jgi:hypothetical protein
MFADLPMQPVDVGRAHVGNLQSPQLGTDVLFDDPLVFDRGLRPLEHDVLFQEPVAHVSQSSQPPFCPCRRKGGLAAHPPGGYPCGRSRESRKMKADVVDHVLGRGVYGTADALRLINFHRRSDVPTRSISRQTIARWLRGYDYSHGGKIKHSDPLWRSDYANDDDTIELSFRDLIEIRFVKAFRDLGLSLTTVRQCFKRAVECVKDERPFSTQKFRTDGETIFLQITRDVHEGELLDLKRRQGVFHRIVAPSLHDLEFDANIVARWFPLGMSRRTVVLDPARAFGRPIALDSGIPAEILSEAADIEGSPERPNSTKFPSLLYVMPSRFSSGSQLEAVGR